MYTRIPLGDITGITKGQTLYLLKWDSAQAKPIGAYILSPLEEASRDPVQNAGFVITWFNSNQVTRLTSYSVRNSIGPLSLPSSPTPAMPSTFGTTPARRALARSATALSKILSNAVTIASSSETTFAAFKVLPIDPARRQETDGGYTIAGRTDELAAASTCRELVDLMTYAIKHACDDVGSTHGEFVTEADVVR
jgi:phosphatidylinositol 4-phosphatase